MLFEYRKLQKLKRNPQAFFTDMIAKKKRQLQNLLPKKKRREGFATYTIVSACYNVEAYLDKFFTSLVRQTLSFRRNIFCIMVDDDSTDNTAAIIKKWQKKYPNNITYIHKENGGQASARNLGMQHVTTPWVTFTDPDDFLAPDYFFTIDDFLRRQTQPINMIGTRIIFYIEDKNIVRDNHPLDFKFRQQELIIPISRLDKEVQLSAASALFRSEVLQHHQLLFDGRIKPNFEDAHFIAHYLEKDSTTSVAYLRDAIYFYRKRGNNSSSLDRSWQDKRKFYDVFIYGKLEILKHFSRRKFIQNTVIYDLIWHIKYLTNNPERTFFLTEQEKSTYLQLLDECFKYISPEMILRFNLAGCWFYHKVGLLYCFKRQDVKSQITYIEAYDPYKQEIRLRYFCGTESLEEFFVGDKEIIPTHAKTVRHDFLKRTFCLERLLWLPLSGTSGKLHCRINNKESCITIAGKQYKEFPIENIQSLFKSTAKVYPQNAPWIIFDRETQADDNAEHLYRWIQRHHPERNAYFVLQKSSHDWCRLKKEGFRMLDYGSPEHEARLRECSKIISSHIDGYVVNYFGDNSTDDKQICWLQHGVTKDDLSRWLNSKKRIDLFVTETPAEYASIIGDATRYRLTDKEVKLLGFPRHDSLLASRNTHKRQLLIMPTWRTSIMGRHLGGNQREKNPDFMKTDYAKTWSSVLQSKFLHEISERYNFEIVFFPHANIQPYLDEFKVPNYIRVIHHYDGSIQDVFLSSAVMLTDYSSVGFEMAYIHKPVVYYQFDEETVFGGQHTYQKGYFDYRKHGFGPVVTDEDSLMQTLEDIFARDGQVSPTYLERMQHTFIFRDGKNCERVYNAISNIDVPMPKDYINIDILKSYTRIAIKKKSWDVAQRRASRLDHVQNDDESHFLRLLCDFRHAIDSGRLLRATMLRDELKKSSYKFFETEFQQGEILLAVYQERYSDALNLLADREDNESICLRAFCLEKLGQRLPQNNVPATRIGELALAYTARDWRHVLEIALDLDESVEMDITVNILACHAALVLHEWEKEGHFRTKILHQFGRCFTWRLLAAQRSWNDGRTNAMYDVFENLRLAFPEGCCAMPDSWLHMCCQAALANGKLTYLQQANKELPEDS